jgi:cephalosporin hydroxylase
MTSYRVGFWRKRAVKAALDRREDRSYSWRGHRVIKFADDLMAMHGLLARCKPEVVVEIGTQNGGSALWFAEVAPQVITLDIAELPGRPVDPRITYLTGDSAAPEVFARVKALVGARRCSVVIDGNHHAEQVDKELALYAPLVGPGQALILEDTLVDVLDFRKFRAGGGPLRSIAKYMPAHPEFRVAEGVEPHVTTNFFGYWVRK